MSKGGVSWPFAHTRSMHRCCSSRGSAAIINRPRGSSADELKDCAESPTVKFKLVSRNKMIERIFGDGISASAAHDEIEDIGIMVRPTLHLPPSSRCSQVHGWALLFACIAVAGCVLYWWVMSLAGGTNNDIKPMRFEHQNAEFSVEEYYTMLLVLSIPIFVLFVYWNWVSMKVFVHN